MSRGRGGYSPRSSYRGGGGYRGSSRGSRGGYSSRGGGGYSSGYDSRPPRYTSSSSERYSSPRGRPSDDYRNKSSYRPESYRERSPERKRPRNDGFRGSERYESFSERRSYEERPPPPAMFRKSEEFRRPSAPAPRRGGYRGRLSSSRGSRGIRRESAFRRTPRLLEGSYGIKRRGIIRRSGDYTRTLKINKLRSSIAAKKGKKSDEEASDDDDGDKQIEIKTEKPDESGKEDADTTVDEEKKTPKVKKETEADKEEEDSDERPQKIFVKLSCPHCHYRSLTFRKYELHLSGRNHIFAMKKIALRQKAILGKMRQAQRATQNEMEKADDTKSKTTNFCPLCKLNYKQKQSEHRESEAHKNMKKFLMPVCKVCTITFKSPMIYENHLASIDHMKRKQRQGDGSENESGGEELENFTTIDSVGDVDGDDAEKKEPKEEKEQINVGIEKIRTVQAHYCDLCKMYLPRGDESEMPKILSKHCKNMVHMRRYVRYKEDKDIEEKAEKLQKKENSEKEDKKKDDDPQAEKAEGDKDTSMEVDEAGDDKMWADVDKDLGDILAEAEDDDEDDSTVNSKERYDRFKLSEKNGEEEESETVENGTAEETK